MFRINRDAKSLCEMVGLEDGCDKDILQILENDDEITDEIFAIALLGAIAQTKYMQYPIMMQGILLGYENTADAIEAIINNIKKQKERHMYMIALIRLIEALKK
jgi:hypothetical protein